MYRVGQDDLAAFRILYEKYKGPIMSYVYSIVRSRALAEELAQEVFLRVYRTRANYEAQAKFTTWLWTIARNLAFDHARKKSEVPMGEELQETDLSIQEIQASIPEAERILLDRATHAGVEKCMEELTLSQKEAVSLRIFSELSYDEIAEGMGASLSSIKSLIHRAKESLMECLRKGGHHE